MLGIADNAQDVLNKLRDPQTFPGALLWAIITGALAWVIARAIGLAFARLLEKPKYLAEDRTAIRFLGQLSQLGIYLFAFLSYAHTVPALRGLGTAWLASVGVVSVVLGLAAQNTLGNLIAGISLVLYRPFTLGDRLQVTAPTGLETGVVESLNLGYTILRTADDRRIVIPNSAMASQTNVNLSLIDERRMCSVPIRIGHQADIDLARKILADLAKQNPKCLEYAGCPLTGLGNFSVTLTVQMWTRDPQTAADLKNELMEAAMKRLEKEGIQLFGLRSDASGKSQSVVSCP